MAVAKVIEIIAGSKLGFDDAVKQGLARAGDTVSNVQKPATLNTGLVIKVPSHIKVGEKVRVSTDTGEFMGRA